VGKKPLASVVEKPLQPGVKKFSSGWLQGRALPCPYCEQEIVPKQCTNGAIWYKCNCLGFRGFVIFSRATPHFFPVLFPDKPDKKEAAVKSSGSGAERGGARSSPPPAPPSGSGKSKMQKMLDRATALGKGVNDA